MFEEVFTIAVYVLIPVYMSAFTLYVVRAVKGPSIADSVLAIDCLSYDLAVFLVLLSIYFKSAFLVGAAITLALWAYLLDIYVSRYLVSREVGA